jgi:hypothetical protein
MKDLAVHWYQLKLTFGAAPWLKSFWHGAWVGHGEACEEESDCEETHCDVVDT